jgi:hypothetical protein
VQPDPFAALAAIAGQHDTQLGADQPLRTQTGDELRGGNPQGEGDLIGGLHGRLERHLAVQFGRGCAGGDRPGIAAG